VETRRAARALGRVVLPGVVLGLEGGLGAGKTFFVEALARGLGVPKDVPVTSPTFTLVHVLGGGRLTLVHADLYRLERGPDVDELGLDDLGGPERVTAIEWWRRLPRWPDELLRIRLDVTGPGTRAIRARARGPRATASLARWKAGLGPSILC